MIPFFLAVLRLLRSFRRGLADEEFRALFYVLIALLISGTIFYWRIEGWSIIDSLYFCVITLATVGYGDLHPTTTFSRIFTIMYVILGIGVFIAFVTKVVTYGKRTRTEPDSEADELRAPDGGDSD